MADPDHKHAERTPGAPQQEAPPAGAVPVALLELDLARQAGPSNAEADSLPPLLALAMYSGEAAGFWPQWTEQACRHLGGELAALYAHAPFAPAGEGWETLSSWPALAGGLTQVPALTATVSLPVLEAVLREGVASGPVLMGNWHAALVALPADSAGRRLLLLVHLPERAGLPAVGELHMLSWLPRLAEAARAARERQDQAGEYALALELLGRVLDAGRFDQAALALANALAERFACRQVSLAWTSRVGMKLRAVSHSEKLARRSELAELLEEAAQEALSQGKEVAWPPTGKLVTHAHRQFASATQAGYLLTLPLMRDDEPLGAVVCEREDRAFTPSEQWLLRLICDQLTLPLRELEQRQRPLWRRLGSEVAQSLPRQLRPLNSDGKRLAAGLAGAALLALLLPWPYRVEASFIIKTDDMAFVGAPFDGYLASSQASLGAAVAAGEPLFSMSTRELVLERAQALADLAQHSREIEKRRAAAQLPEMRIAEAQFEQAQARLDQVEFRLRNANVISPIAGIIVEGEPRKNLGGPVKRGDTVVKVARVDGLYAEIAVKERDLEQIAVGQDASIMLVSNPSETWDMKLRQVTPAPSVRDGHNTFPVRAEPVSPPPSWWRPGMTGVARISTGWRPLGWILTHRLVEWLRLTFWI